MDTTPIKTHMDFFGKGRLIDFLLNPSASLPVNLDNTNGGIYYNSNVDLASISNKNDGDRFIPYITEIPTSTKLALIGTNGKITTVYNADNNKFLFLYPDGSTGSARYVTKSWIDPDFLSTSIIDSDDVIPTSGAVYNAIKSLGDITGDYLPLTGGTLTGPLYMGNGDGIPIKFLQNNSMCGSIWSGNGTDIRIETSDEIKFSLRNYPTDEIGGYITMFGDYDSKYFNIVSYSSISGFKSKILGFTEINLRDDNLIKFITGTSHNSKIFASNVDSEDQITIEALHTLITDANNHYFHISGNVLTGSSGSSIGLINDKIKYIYGQEIYADTIILPSNNSMAIKYFNGVIKSSLDANSSNTLLSETAIYNAIKDSLSLATTLKSGLIPILPTNGENYYLNGDNEWIEREWVVSTIDGKKYLSTGIGNFKSFNVSLISNGEISIGSEYLLMETLPTTDPNLVDSAFPTALYIGRNSLKPSSVNSVLHVEGSIKGSAFTTDNVNYWKMLGVSTGTFTPNKIIYVNINGVNYGIAATDNLT